MNLEGVVEWGRKTLALVDDPSGLERLGMSAGRVEAKLGWLVEFREALQEWSSYHELIEGTLGLVRRRGLSRNAGEELSRSLPVMTETSNGLRAELIEFVTAESSKAKAGEILPGTTEVLESCFGKLKALEKIQSRSGFTGLVLSLGTMVSKRSAEDVAQALERCRVRDVTSWCRKKIGETIQSKRKQAYSPPKCEQIQDERPDKATPTFHQPTLTLPRKGGGNKTLSPQVFWSPPPLRGGLGWGVIRCRQSIGAEFPTAVSYLVRI